MKNNKTELFQYKVDGCDKNLYIFNNIPIKMIKMTNVERD